MSEIIRDVLGNQAKIVALSGPTHAEEVVRDMPSTIVSACDDLEVAEKYKIFSKIHACVFIQTLMSAGLNYVVL